MTTNPQDELVRQLMEATAEVNRIQMDYFCGRRTRADLNEAMCRVGDLRNQLGYKPQQSPTLSAFIVGPGWILQPKEEWNT
jgi:hypothetical protein